MKITQIIILFFLLTISCKKENDIIELDSKINSKIENAFIIDKKDIWPEFEDAFLKYLNEKNSFYSEQNINRSIYEFICKTRNYGGIVEKLNPSDVIYPSKLIVELEKIGVLNNKTFNYNFFYDNYNPLVKRYIDQNSVKFDKSSDLLIGMGLTEPRKTDFQIALISNNICKKYKPKDFNRPGLYKSLIILYFGNVLELENTNHNNGYE